MLRKRAILTSARKTVGLMLILTAMAAKADAGAPPPPTAPEIDPGSVLSAMALLGGGLLMLTDRRRAKAKVS